MHHFWIFSFLFCFPLLTFGQQADSMNFQEDLIVSESKIEASDTIIADHVQESDSAFATTFMTPKKTAMFSAILPGLGQIYNRDYWKVPIIYVGIGVAVYFIHDNLKNYNEFRRIYAGRISNNPASFLEYPEYSDETVRQARDFYRKNLDLTVLLTAAGYTLQVLDAVIFAHLKNFDISEDISFRMKPVSMPQGGFGIGIVMNF